MTLEARIHGFTAWANFRFQIVGHGLIKNILSEYMDGFNMKILVESLTGRTFQKLKTFDGLSPIQKETRFKWIVEELKKCEIINAQKWFNYRLIASKYADEVFELFSEMVRYDVQFLWLRADFLQQKNHEDLIGHPLRFANPALVTSHQESNLLLELISPTENGKGKISSKRVVNERDSKMINQAKLRVSRSATACLMGMINDHHMMARGGGNITHINTFQQLIDSRVLCALVNSLVPDTITSEVLLNDRWTMNLALQVIMDMSRCSSSFNVEHLLEVDSKALEAYFAFFFMCGYSLCQSRAVVSRIDSLKIEILKREEELDEIPTVIYKEEIFIRKKSVETILANLKEELWAIEANFEVEMCRQWMIEIQRCQDKIRKIVSYAMEQRYEVIDVPFNTVLNDYAANTMINLSLTYGYGYYECIGKEFLTKDRKMLVWDKRTELFHDSNKMLLGKKCVTARNLLDLSRNKNIEIDSRHYPDFTIFLEALSCNKVLKVGSKYVYKIFPDDLSRSLNSLFKAIRDGRLHSVIKLVSFFKMNPSFINGCYGDSKNTPLHIACNKGHFEIVLYLLEENALLNATNVFGNTPFFLAVLNGHREICKLLIEWDADTTIRNKSGITALDAICNEVFLDFIKETSSLWERTRKELLSGKLDTLHDILEGHLDGKRPMASLRSRCVNGSTLLHVASYFGETQAVKQLLSFGMDVDIPDCKQATALHRARRVDVMELLRKYNINWQKTDQDGNTALHVRCYGERGKQTKVDAIKLLISKGIDIIARNTTGLMAIHCAAIQGRHEAIKELLDAGDIVTQELLAETEAIPPSILYLAIVNDHLECTEWLRDKGFSFKEKEVEKLLQKIFLKQHDCKNKQSVVEFLYTNGDVSSLTFPENNSPLHIASSQPELLEVLQFCIDQNHCIDALNDDFCTPLHMAVQANNLHAAAALIAHDATLTLKNRSGLAPFDFVKDFDQWLTCGLFSENVNDVLEAFNMKQARELVRSITRKINSQDT